MLTAEELTALEEQHGRIERVSGKNGAWEVVYRAPKRTEYKRFRSLAHDPARKSDAQEMLALSCVVHPSPAAFEALLDKFPAIPEASADALGRLVGAETDDSVKP